jgi:hypothetical protein
LEFVEQNFESVKNPKTEVDRGFRFWDTVSHDSLLFCTRRKIRDLTIQVMVAVRTMAKLQKTTKEDDHRVFPNPEQTLEEFEMADRWLQPMRP